MPALRSSRALPLLLSSLYRLSRAVPWPSPLVLAATSAAGEDHEPIDSETFWIKMVISAGLVLLGGVFAGLTLGLMGLDELHLRVLAASSDNPRERLNASKGTSYAYLK